MSEKEKRKSNPRRGLLIRLLLGIGVVAALISVGIYALRPTGAQIVFIAPDDNGVDNIWIADLNNPENPRQLTNYSEGVIPVLRVSSENSVSAYTSYGESGATIWILDLKTDNYEQVYRCSHIDACLDFSLSPNGLWIAIEDMPGNSIRRDVDALVILNTQSQIVTPLYDSQMDFVATFQSIRLGWVQETGQLVYRSEPITNPNSIVFYDVEAHTVISQSQTIEMGHIVVEISPDGTQYALTTQLWGGDRHSVVNIHEFASTNTILYSTKADSGEQQYNSYFLDWHPNSEAILVTEGMQRDNIPVPRLDSLKIYNIVTGEQVIISENIEHYSYMDAQFNSDGTQILYGMLSRLSYISQIMLYDMETREEIALPLFGHSPQWVNGGR